MAIKRGKKVTSCAWVINTAIHFPLLRKYFNKTLRTRTLDLISLVKELTDEKMGAVK